MAAQAEERDVITGSDLRDLVESIQSMAPRRKITVAEFKTKNPFNPGGANRKFTRVVYQNGHRVQTWSVMDEELKLWNAIQPGRYIDKLVTVRKVDGENGSLDEIHLEYANKTPDQRIQLGKKASSLLAILRQCNDEWRAANVQSK